MLKATLNHIEVDDGSIDFNNVSSLSAVIDQTYLYEYMTATDNMIFTAIFHNKEQKKIKELLHDVGLDYKSKKL